MGQSEATIIDQKARDTKIRPPLDVIICGDCENILKTFPENSIDLIVTSPPYADREKQFTEVYIRINM